MCDIVKAKASKDLWGEIRINFSILSYSIYNINSIVKLFDIVYAMFLIENRAQFILWIKGVHSILQNLTAFKTCI